MNAAQEEYDTECARCDTVSQEGEAGCEITRDKAKSTALEKLAKRPAVTVKNSRKRQKGVLFHPDWGKIVRGSDGTLSPTFKSLAANS